MPPNSFSPPPPGFAPPPTQMPPPPYMDINSPPQVQPSVVVVGTTAFGPESQRLTCPYCHNNITTTVETEANTKTHLFAFLLCIFGLWCCVPCPYCMDSCLVKKHYCPSCQTYLGQSDN